MSDRTTNNIDSLFRAIRRLESRVTSLETRLHVDFMPVQRVYEKTIWCESGDHARCKGTLTSIHTSHPGERHVRIVHCTCQCGHDAEKLKAIREGRLT